MPDQDAFQALALVGPRRHSLAVWIWSALVLADVVLMTRRMSGEFTAVLPSSIAVFSSLIVAITSLGAWFLFASVSRLHATKLQSVAPQAISLTITVIWCWSLSVAVSPLAVGMLVSIVLLQLGVLAAASDSALSETALSMVSSEVLATPQAHSPLPIIATVPPTFSVNCAEPDVEETESAAEGTEETDEGLTLWLSRRTTEEAEQIEGWVRVEFAAGQRETVVHVAFCPPLPGLPEIETEDLEGDGLEIRVAAAFAFGARLSVRRSGAGLNDSTAVRVGFFAQAHAANRAA